VPSPLCLPPRNIHSSHAVHLSTVCHSAPFPIVRPFLPPPVPRPQTLAPTALSARVRGSPDGCSRATAAAVTPTEHVHLASEVGVADAAFGRSRRCLWLWLRRYRPRLPHLPRACFSRRCAPVAATVPATSTFAVVLCLLGFVARHTLVVNTALTGQEFAAAVRRAFEFAVERLPGLTCPPPLILASR